MFVKTRILKERVFYHTCIKDSRKLRTPYHKVAKVLRGNLLAALCGSSVSSVVEVLVEKSRTPQGGIEGELRIKVGNMEPACCERKSQREHSGHALLQAPVVDE